MQEDRMMPQKGDPKKEPFILTGQDASSVQMDGDREFVMYESDNGEMVKVYGNWSKHSKKDEDGKDLILDTEYPIMVNESEEFVMDEEAFEKMDEEVMGKRKSNKTNMMNSIKDILNEDKMQFLNQPRGQR